MITVSPQSGEHPKVVLELDLPDAEVIADGLFSAGGWDKEVESIWTAIDTLEKEIRSGN